MKNIDEVIKSTLIYAIDETKDNCYGESDAIRFEHFQAIAFAYITGYIRGANSDISNADVLEINKAIQNAFADCKKAGVL